MTVFDLTKGLCEQITAMICRFFWAQQDNDNKIHWVSKEKLTLSKTDGGLGYKDLHTFNLSMLVKQAWRMLESPDSLCAQVLKAKYFPDTDIMQAVAKEGMSYTWRSILQGLEVVKNGAIKRIGDGTSIKIWEDPWIPRNWDRRPFTRQGNAIITTVDELINPITASWDDQLVKSIFWASDAALILALPIREDMEDSWAWHPDPRGCFSVKSAYKLCKQLERVREGEEGPMEKDSGGFDWHLIWKAPCPMKVQQFLWRIAHNSLPLCTNLKHRGVEVDSVCPICKRLDEDGGHMLFKCKLVRHLWRDVGLEEVRTKCVQLHDSMEVLQTLLQGNEERKALCVALIWSWWCARNKLRAEGRKIDFAALVWRVRNTAREFLQFFGADKKPTVQTTVCWQKPPPDHLKINVDGSFNKENSAGGWGYVIRDSDGDMVIAGAGRLEHAQDALHSEAEACVQGLYKAQELGMGKIMMETDAMQLVQAIKTAKYDLSPNGVIFREIKAFVSLNFSSFQIEHCPRAYNNVADALALFGLKMGQVPPAVWPGIVPTFAQVFVASGLARQVE